MTATRPSFICGLAIALFACLAPCVSHAQIKQGDLAWGLRAEVLDGQLATPERIEEAIGHYRAALEAAPASLEPSWKLMRALHYAIDFTTLDERAKTDRLEHLLELASNSNEGLETGSGTDADRARLYFWSSIAWGARAQRVGLLTIVRERVAGRMHDYAERSLALDPSVDEGGALRLLSRLHATLPRVPFVSGWVDREQALPLAERAHALDATHPGNRLILALALLERAPERRGEAEALLESVARAAPRPNYLVEDMAIREQAAQQLEGPDEES